MMILILREVILRIYVIRSYRTFLLESLWQMTELF